MYSKLSDCDGSGPYIDAMLEFPHRCTFKRLVQVQECYSTHVLSRELFDEWMAVNGGDYLLGIHPTTMKLWEEVKQAAKNRGHSDSPKEGSGLGQAIQVRRCGTHGRRVFKINWKKVGARKHLKPLNSIWGWSSPADKSKTCVDVASLLYEAKLGDLTGLVDMMMPYISDQYSNVTAVGLLIHAMGNEAASRVIDIYKKYKACCMSEEQYIDFHKALSVAIRRTSRWEDGSVASVKDITAAASWELAIGRSRNTSDWAAEVHNRCHHNFWLRPGESSQPASKATNHQYLQRLGTQIKMLIRQLDLCNITWTSWPDFVDRRQEWVSGGSSGGAKLMVNGKQVRINKHMYFEEIDDKEMYGWIDSEPRIEATGSEKFESGKARAIYGTKPRDYAIMTYVLRKIELILHRMDGIEAGLRGFDEVATVVRRVGLVQQDGVECTMLDYADFNIQHTPAAQTLLFDVLAEELEENGAHPDVIKAARWCALGLSNQWVKFPNGTEYKKVIQGMFSGVRGTHFINTVLNAAYFLEAAASLEGMLCLTPVNLYHIHQGDDVWITNMSRLWAIALYAYMQSAGFVFQNSKQVFDVSRGEFLRVLYGHDGARGYLARSVATLIIKPLQGVEELGPAEKAGSLNSQINILFRRGLSLPAAKALWRAIIPFFLGVVLPDGGGVSVPLGVAMKPYELGGLDLGWPMTLGRGATTSAPIPVAVSGSPVLEAASNDHMTRAWIRVISQQFGEEFDVNRVSKLVHANNTMDSLRPEDRQHSLRILEKQLKKWIGNIDDRTGTRSAQAFSDWMGRVKIDHIVEREVSALDCAFANKTGFSKSTQLDVLIAAVSQSPFRDLSTAQRALNIGIVAAAKECLKLSTNIDKAALAASMISMLESRCSMEVTARVLSGVRGAGSSYESILGPIVLSWCSKVGTDYAIIDAIYKGIQTTGEWDKLHAHWHDRIVGGTVANGRLLKISNY